MAQLVAGSFTQRGRGVKFWTTEHKIVQIAVGRWI